MQRKSEGWETMTDTFHDRHLLYVGFLLGMIFVYCFIDIIYFRLPSYPYFITFIGVVLIILIDLIDLHQTKKVEKKK
jgi:hypothetical protein